MTALTHEFARCCFRFFHLLLTPGKSSKKQTISSSQSPIEEANWLSRDQVDQSAAHSAGSWPTMHSTYLWDGHRCLGQPWTLLLWWPAADPPSLSPRLAWTSRSAFSFPVGDWRITRICLVNRVVEKWELVGLEASRTSAGGTQNLGSYSVPFLEPLQFLSFHYDSILGPVAVHQNTNYSTVATLNLLDGSEILPGSLREHSYVLFLCHLLGGFLSFFFFFKAKIFLVCHRRIAMAKTLSHMYSSRLLHRSQYIYKLFPT